MRRRSLGVLPRYGLHTALALLLSACGGSTREEILGLGDSTVGGTGAGASGGGAGLSAGGRGGGSDQVGGSGGQGADGDAGGTSAGADGDTASGGNGGTAGTEEGAECAPRASNPGPSALDGGSPTNLISNPSFESGHAGWVGMGTPIIIDVSEHPHTGLKCLGATDRSQIWMGPRLPIGSLVTAGSSYEVSAWVRVSAEPERVRLTLRQLCGEEQEATFQALHADAATVCDWTRLSGQFVAPSCALTSLDLFIDGARAGVDIFVDDVALFAAE